jgi:tetratricopeptide (TPR) repeat protein
MTFTKLANLTLMALWTVTLGGLTVLVLWFSSPDLIESADQVFRRHYLYEPIDRYQHIIHEYEQTNDHLEVISALLELTEDLERVQRIDELMSVKRVTFAQLVRVFVRIEQFEQAAIWVEKWLEFDPKDVEAQLFKARLLVINPNTRADGEYQLGVIKNRFPNALPVANGRAAAYANVGELGRAFLEFLPFLPGSEHLLPRKIGETLRVIDYSHREGDPVTPMTEDFESSDSLELHIQHTPEDAAVQYDPTGLQETDYGYRKRIGYHGVLHLYKYKQSQDFDIKVTVKVAAPEILEKLMELQFQSLVTTQLQEMGEAAAIDTYEAFRETL